MAANEEDETEGGSWLSAWLAKPEGERAKGSGSAALARLLDKSAFVGRVLVVYVWFWILLALAMAIWHFKDPAGAEHGWGIEGYVKGTETRLIFSNPPPQPSQDKKGRLPAGAKPKTEPEDSRLGPPQPWRRGPAVCPDGTTFGN